MATNRITNMDLLREKAEITYEEAAELLTKYDDDVTRALIELEKRGKLKKPGKRVHATYAGTSAEGAAGAEPGTNAHVEPERRGEFMSGLSRLISKGFSYRVIVAHGDEIIANLPVLFVLAVLFPGFHLVVFTMVCILLSGSRIYVRRRKATVNVDDFSYVARKAADNVRHSVNSFANEPPFVDETAERRSEEPAPEAKPDFDAQKAYQDAYRDAREAYERELRSRAGEQQPQPVIPPQYAPQGPAKVVVTAPVSNPENAKQQTGENGEIIVE